MAYSRRVCPYTGMAWYRGTLTGWTEWPESHSVTSTRRRHSLTGIYYSTHHILLYKLLYTPYTTVYTTLHTIYYCINYSTHHILLYILLYT